MHSGLHQTKQSWNFQTFCETIFLFDSEDPGDHPYKDAEDLCDDRCEDPRDDPCEDPPDYPCKDPRDPPCEDPYVDPCEDLRDILPRIKASLTKFLFKHVYKYDKFAFIWSDHMAYIPSRYTLYFVCFIYMCPDILNQHIKICPISVSLNLGKKNTSIQS